LVSFLHKKGLYVGVFGIVFGHRRRTGEMEFLIGRLAVRRSWFDIL
jgi:hypothetical protein